ncbi:manganese-dependent ADP-ribose/CDP-alcohol diphosphatase-like [Stylophora pistillata]|nr:manganese-dependent ADP-ribose/CDP-alcohol diphosphatase-like [Stylophora pistillata]
MDPTNGDTDVLFSFGLITDIQYADICDRQNSAKTRWRRYRNALCCLQEAVDHWIRPSRSLSFIVQLGDIIDGFNTDLNDANDSERNSSQDALDLVMREFSKLPPEIPVFHNLGNHELYNFSREELSASILHPFNSCESSEYLSKHQSLPAVSEEETKPFYFSFVPHPKFCFVYLDSYDTSLHGFDETSSTYKDALAMVRKYNKNGDLDSADGLHGLNRRFVAYNGGIGPMQLQWLQAVLEVAIENGQKAVIFSHVPISPGNRPRRGAVDLLWNYQDVLKVLWQSGCVVACFHGHTHYDDYFVDKHGIHHLTFEGVITAPLDSNAFATLHVKNDAIVIEGFGVIESRVLKFFH